MKAKKIIAYIPVQLEIENFGEGYDKNLKDALACLSGRSFSTISGKYSYSYKNGKVKDIIIKENK